MGDVIVLTARERPENVRQQISNLSLTNLITDLIVVPPSDSVNKKERILRRLRPTLFIGDTESDYRAAQLSDIPFRAVSSGMRSRDFLLACLNETQIYNDVNILIRELLNEVT